MTEQFNENKNIKNASPEEEQIFLGASSPKFEPSNTETKPGQYIPGLVIFALAVIAGGGFLLLLSLIHIYIDILFVYIGIWEKTRKQSGIATPVFV